MGRTKSAKKSVSKISDRIEKRIVEAALQNPERGAKRLVSLLERENIDVSSSQVYHILQRHDLQTREKRRALSEKQAAASKAPPANPLTEITPEIEEVIVDTSLQHPEFGARRLLPLLQAEGYEVSASRIYGILKRKGLQNREKRLAAADERDAASETARETAADGTAAWDEEPANEVFIAPPDDSAGFLPNAWPAEEEMEFPPSWGFSPTDEDHPETEAAAIDQKDVPYPVGPPEQPFEIPLEEDAPESQPSGETAPAPGKDAEATIASRILRRARGRDIGSGKIRWLFRCVNLLLLVLVGYLGFITVQNFQQARMEMKAAAAFAPPQAAAVPRKGPAAQQPLQAYSRIWERNLFNVKEKETPAPAKETPVEEITLAKKSIGLQLVGTVVAHDASLNRAVIHVQKTKREETYREGDRTGQILIKKILRNKVVVTTAEGDQLLIIDPMDYADRRASLPISRASRGLQPPPQPVGAASSVSPATASSLSSPRPLSIKLKREQVESSLADVNELLQELQISPFLQDDQPAGFILGKIPRRSILTRMGLRNGYAVTRLNDRPITGPEQAAEFFQTLAAGGEVVFQIERSRGIRRRAREISLNIE